jgi:sulfite exporter TauE/SafE/plastocyanin domain-containing protein/copper chaperone CopZ
MSQNKYIKIPIKGMHCRSCEILIEENLKEIDNIKSVDISYKTGEATIYYDGNTPPTSQIHKVINDSGYSVGVNETLPFITRNKKEYVNLGIAFLFLTVIYFILRGLGLTNLNLTPDISSPSWGLVILIGVVAGFSTCMALVGGLSLGLSTKFIESHPTATTSEKFRPHLFFILGRILSYTLLGGVLGMIGAVSQLSSMASGIVTALVGIVMLIMGLQLINIFPRLTKLKLTLPKSISKAFGINTKSKEYNHGQAMIMGAFTFFLPCGFTQAMQLYAISTGTFGFGALVMGLFALGTAPGLLSIGGVTSLVHGEFKEKFFKVAGLAVIFFGLFNLNNGYTLVSLSINGTNDSSSNQETVANDLNVTLENGVQIVKMTESSSGYLPNKFSVKKGVPVKWIIDAKAPYSCASVVLVPKLKIQKFLSAGENIVEFTPNEVGTLPFSCSMGMYTGEFDVYDDNAPVSSVPATQNIVNTAQAASANSGTCGVSGGGCGCGGGANKVVTNSVPVTAQTTQDTANNGSVQVIKSTYTSAKYLDPAVFKVKAGTKVRLEIDVKDNGTGCGYAMTISGLYNQIVPIKAGTPIVMEFTPTKPGSYDITCSMNMIRFGSIVVE